MQERRLRLGDVLDDYCPREKRLTNHVIVALVGDDVRQTRCSTCDTEHVYKGGKLPARRRKAEPKAALYKTVLENITGEASEADVPAPSRARAEDAPELPAAVAATPVAAAPAAAPRPVQPPAAAAASPPVPPVTEAQTDGGPTAGEEPVHRHQLIRATLPKVEGQVPERKQTDFTSWNVARQPQGRRGRPSGGRPGPGGADWSSGYSPYANGHPNGKSSRPGPPHGRPARPNQNQNRRGR